MYRRVLSVLPYAPGMENCLFVLVLLLRGAPGTTRLLPPPADRYSRPIALCAAALLQEHASNATGLVLADSEKRLEPLMVTQAHALPLVVLSLSSMDLMEAAGAFIKPTDIVMVAAPATSLEELLTMQSRHDRHYQVSHRTL